MHPSKKFQPMMEFHVSRQVRDRHRFNETLFTTRGNAIFANFHAAREFAQKMNEKRDLVRYPDKTVKAGHINAMGLIDEILHFVFKQYRDQKNPPALEKAMSWLVERFGSEAVERTLLNFADEFPPSAVYRHEIHLDDYLAGKTESTPNKQLVLEELIMLWLANTNPGFSPYLELFDDRSLEDHTEYSKIMNELEEFFDTQPGFGPDDEPLIKLLRAPALASPHSLAGQLKYIREKWHPLLGKYLQLLLSSLDFIREEQKPGFMGPGPAQVLKFTDLDYLEEERFSPDKDWMPRLVLLAKNAYVWLDQLSREYQRPITRLDLVPDEELDRLARSGFSGLWLIGLWERSSASRRIKQMCGNPEAVASAYSLYDYVIAERLGGESALDDLRYRAQQRGIRLAADMVPNHVGIYSKWVVEHPDWFISLDYSPFPTYTFEGENLSKDDRVGIYLENHYYSRDDAAVVFKRVDHWTGDEKFIYHGNDGTSMPWNDTAQLNFLKAEVREAVIQTILHVARKFPVIRFDAAMTLAKKHYQRLWFPEPGTGGDIPSRSEYGLTREQFNEAMPVEFWREVVDRVAEEVPDTLLLAEAFWMMEGYFVRTLGMHRVYNSAFMNMLRDEKNDQYRQLIKNTLEFDPDILKRYVNFMNNPDEKTSVEQFGKDDKYFGICTMMSTMPGLPMFGHGQVEGFAEKYGMEYQRAYWDERPDYQLLRRHEREIFPLLHRRYLFAEVDHFFLYDFFTPEGYVEENVFAYSNRVGQPGTQHCQRALVVYHNRWADVRGWIKTSAAYKNKAHQSDQLFQTDLGVALGLENSAHAYVIFRDHVTGLEYIRNNRKLFDHGLYIELAAYKYHVFMDFREVKENEWRQYAQLAEYLDGSGVPNIEETFTEIILKQVREPYKKLVSAQIFQQLIENRSRAGKLARTILEATIVEVEKRAQTLFRQIASFTESTLYAEALTENLSLVIRTTLDLPRLLKVYQLPKSRNFQGAVRLILSGEDKYGSLENGTRNGWGILLGWALNRNLGMTLAEVDYEALSGKLMDEWLLGKIIAGTLIELGIDQDLVFDSKQLIKVLVKHQNWHRKSSPKRGRTARILETWLEDPDVQKYLNINRYSGIYWFNKEAMESFLRWMLAVGAVHLFVEPDSSSLREPGEGVAKELADLYSIIKKIKKASEASEYQVEQLLQGVR